LQSTMKMQLVASVQSAQHLACVYIVVVVVIVVIAMMNICIDTCCLCNSL
jgi:hypothetical protein